MSRIIRDIGGFSGLLITIIGIGLLLLITGGVIGITNCGGWMGDVCTSEIGWIPKPLLDVLGPLTFIGFVMFIGGIGVSILYHYASPARPPDEDKKR